MLLNLLWILFWGVIAALVVWCLKGIRNNTKRQIESMDDGQNMGLVENESREYHPDVHVFRPHQILPVMDEVPAFLQKTEPDVKINKPKKTPVFTEGKEKGVHVHNPLAPKPQPLPGIGKKPKSKKKKSKNK